MGRTVVKRFPDSNMIGASAGPTISRWAESHNAKVVSQSSNGSWVTVTFELLDSEPSQFEPEIHRGRSGTLIQTSQITDEELLKSYREDLRREKSPPPKETRVVVKRVEEPSEKNKKRWWKR